MAFFQVADRKLIVRTALVLIFFALGVMLAGVEPALGQSGPARQADQNGQTVQTAQADAAAADTGAVEVDYDSMAQIWSTRASDLSALVDEAATLHNLAEDLAVPLSGRIADTRAQIARLSSLFQVSRGHPTEQLALLSQMRGLRDGLGKSIKPLEEIAATLAINLEDVAQLDQEMDSLRKENVAEGVEVAPDDTNGKDEFKNYIQAMSEAKIKLAKTSKRLTQILGPARGTLKRLDDILAKFEGSLDGVWRSYYLTPSSNDIAALATTPAALTEWTSSLGTRLSFAYPQNAPQWWDALKNIVLSGLLLGLLGFAALRGVRFLPEHWHGPCRGAIRGVWVWLAAGLSILSAATTSSGGIYFAFVLSGVLMVIYGVAAMSWRLLVAVRPMLQGKPSPLGRLFPPAVLGVVMLFSDLPARVLGIIWPLAMIIFLVRIFSINRKHKKTRHEHPPLLERLFYGCALWFGAGSLLVAVAGYARLAILLYMLLFALVNTITLGNGLMHMLGSLLERWLSKEERPVLNAVAEAVIIPFSWVLSLVCTLPWLWAVPGASHILRQGLVANYTVGDASFDFSKILFIAVLFFLFRSLISLSRTTLKHLPDRLPHLERGVIPPLQTMSAYVFWVLFALVALGMLGVDFTSLAVVAGGLSVGIGFGMQTLFNNLISGLMLIFGRILLVGDYVEVGGIAGTVRAISIRSTVIETPDRALVYVPNSNFMSGQFSNWTRNSRMVRRNIPVGVAYGSDADLVTRLLLRAAEEQNHVLKHPAPFVTFNNFGPSSLDFTLYVFIDDLDNGMSTLSGLRAKIQRLLTEHGIDIPFPQMTLHMPEKEQLPAMEKNKEAVKVQAQPQAQPPAEGRKPTQI